MLKKLISKIEGEEGYSERMYKCPADYWTIGAGINLETTAIPKEVADKWLEIIVQGRISTLKSFAWYHSLNEARQIVIADMAYQMGVSGLLRFQKMIQAILEADYDTAAREMLDSKWAREDSPARADRNAKIMRTGKMVSDYEA